MFHPSRPFVFNQLVFPFFRSYLSLILSCLIYLLLPCFSFPLPFCRPSQCIFFVLSSFLSTRFSPLFSPTVLFSNRLSLFFHSCLFLSLSLINFLRHILSSLPLSFKFICFFLIYKSIFSISCFLFFPPISIFALMSFSFLSSVYFLYCFHSLLLLSLHLILSFFTLFPSFPLLRHVCSSFLRVSCFLFPHNYRKSKEDVAHIFSRLSLSSPATKVSCFSKSYKEHF